MGWKTYQFGSFTGQFLDDAGRAWSWLRYVLALILGFALALTVHAEEKIRIVPGQILLKPKARVTVATLQTKLEAQGIKPRRSFPDLNIRLVSVPEDRFAETLAALRNDPDVEFAEPDYLAYPTLLVNDPYVVSGSEWHLAKIQAPQAWDVAAGRTNVIVAVIDSGVNAAHPDLAGRVLPGYDFTVDLPQASDDFGHGTAVAGVIAAAGNNGFGVAGVANGCSILPVKVMTATGLATYSAVIAGIEYAVHHGARVINLSLAGSAWSQAMQDAVDYAWANNVVIVASAGNTSTNTFCYPAGCNHVLAVTATTADDTLSSFSSFGRHIVLSAPGENIWTTQRDPVMQYGAWRGTSFASPQVASVAALVIARNPGLTNAGIVSILERSADDLGAQGRDDSFGFGRVNAFRAVTAAGEGMPLPPTVTTNTPPPPPSSPSTNVPPAVVTPPAVLPPTNPQATNGFRLAKGSYTGLVLGRTNRLAQNTGGITLKVNKLGTFSAQVSLGGGRHSFSGRFNSTGEAMAVSLRSPTNPVTLRLNLDLEGNGDRVTGTVSNREWTSELAGFRNVFHKRLNPAPQVGSSTFAFHQGEDSMTAASGTTKISLAGLAKLREVLADGRKLVSTGPLASDGDYPFCVSLRRGSEMMVGWLNFSATSPHSPVGNVTWLYTGTNGFSLTLSARAAAQ